MADAWLRCGLDPGAPDEVVLVIVVDARHAPGERAVSRLGLCAHEGDDAFYLSQTDGWVERRLDGRTLVADVVAYPCVLEGLDLAVAGFTERSRVDPAAVRLLRVTTTVDPVDYGRARQTTVVWEAPAGSAADQVVAAIRAEADWPIICAPPPAPSEVDRYPSPPAPDGVRS